HRTRQKAQHAGIDVMLKSIADQAGKHGNHTFGSLERHIPYKTVTHHYIRHVIEDAVTLYVADVIESRTCRQHMRRQADLLAPLDILFTHINQSNPRMLLLLNDLHHQRAQDRELEQMFCRAVHIGSQIQHITTPPRGGNATDNSGTVNTGRGLENRTPEGHQSTSVTGTNTDLSTSLLNDLQGDRHGGLGTMTKCKTGFVIHAHVVRRINKGNTFGGIIWR